MKKIIPLLILAALFAASSVWAEPVIKDFEFTGLKRTQPKIVKKEVSDFIGKEATEENLHDIETRIQAAGMFSDIVIECADADAEETVVNISVKEKFSFFPIPMAAYSGGSVSAGFFLADMNFMGTMDKFIIGGMGSKDTALGIVGYIRSARGYYPGFSLVGIFCMDDSSVKNLDNDTFYEYNQTSGSLTMMFNQNLPCNMYVNTSLEGKLKYLDKEPLSPNDRFYKAGVPAVEFGIKHQDWNGWFLSESTVKVKDSVFITDTLDIGNTLYCGAKIEQPVLPRLRITSEVAGIGQENTHIVEWVKGSDVAVTILPSKFLTTKIFGGNLGLEFAAIKLPFGFISVYGDYQLCIAKNTDKNYEFNQGPAAGIKLYISKLAIPAIGIEANYNITHNKAQGTFVVGMSM